MRFICCDIPSFVFVLLSLFKIFLVHFLLLLPSQSPSSEGLIVLHKPCYASFAFQMTRNDDARRGLIKLLRTDKFMGNVKASFLSDNLEKFVNPNFYVQNEQNYNFYDLVCNQSSLNLIVIFFLANTFARS